MFRSPTITGRVVHLEPLHESHAADLASDLPPDTFSFFSSSYAPRGNSIESISRYIHDRSNCPNTISLAIIDLKANRAVGSSCYIDIRPEHKGIEIGATFLSASARGTLINPETKLLMLTYAFETLECLRVQLKCDARNTRSMRAIEGIGATKEGVLRKHLVAADGFLRDTVMYSIIDTEWPRVRSALRERLGQ